MQVIQKHALKTVPSPVSEALRGVLEPTGRKSTKPNLLGRFSDMLRSAKIHFFSLLWLVHSSTRVVLPTA